MSVGHIRELQPTDDFAKLAEMSFRLLINNEQRIRCAPKHHHFKNEFFNEHDQFHENVIAYVSVDGKDQRWLVCKFLLNRRMDF